MTLSHSNFHLSIASAPTFANFGHLSLGCAWGPEKKSFPTLQLLLVLSRGSFEVMRIFFLHNTCVRKCLYTTRNTLEKRCYINICVTEVVIISNRDFLYKNKNTSTLSKFKLQCMGLTRAIECHRFLSSYSSLSTQSLPTFWKAKTASRVMLHLDMVPDLPNCY